MKKNKKSLFFSKYNKYNWTSKEERERDRRIIDSFNYAIEGLIEAIRNEKHMRVHMFTSVIIILLAIMMNASRVEILIIALSISFVIITELINTAVEALVDLISPKRHPLAKLAKDVAAGSVLVASLNAFCVGYLLFYDKLMKLLESQHRLLVIAGRKGNVSILIIMLTAILVIVIKSIYKKGTPLEGGMPSGHSAIAFSIFGIMLFLVADIRVLFLVFIMALLVAQSRVKAGIHSFREVLIGGLLGFLISFTILYTMTLMGVLYN